MTIDDWTRPSCLLHGNRLDRFMRRLDTVVQFVQCIDVTVSSCTGPKCSKHDIGEEVAWIIASLPQRFNIEAVSFSHRAPEERFLKLDLDRMVNVLQIKKPQFRFLKFDV